MSAINTSRNSPRNAAASIMMRSSFISGGPFFRHLVEPAGDVAAQLGQPALHPRDHDLETVLADEFVAPLDLDLVDLAVQLGGFLGVRRLHLANFAGVLVLEIPRRPCRTPSAAPAQSATTSTVTVVVT